MSNIYEPEKVRIIKIEPQSEDAKLLRLEKKGGFAKNEQGLVFNPGQFVLAGAFGYGEAPFGAASPPYESRYLDLVIRKVGALTEYLHQVQPGDEIFLRGPYGNGFPMDFMRGKDIVMVTGGCGIPPIAAMIEYLIVNKKDYGRPYLIYGAKTPQGILLKEKLKAWEREIKVILTVDQPDKEWSGAVGLVTELISGIEIDGQNAVAAMCGPGPMTEALEKILRPLGISDRRIFVNMERKMQCGVGRCQHCTVGDKYVCHHGPVFNFDEIDKAWDR